MQQGSRITSCVNGDRASSCCHCEEMDLNAPLCKTDALPLTMELYKVYISGSCFYTNG